MQPVRVYICTCAALCSARVCILNYLCVQHVHVFVHLCALLSLYVLIKPYTCAACASVCFHALQSAYICVLITGAPLNHLLLLICPLPNSYLLPQTELGHDVCPFQVPIDSSPPMPGKTCLAVKCPEERTRKREVGDRLSSSRLNCEHHKKLLKIAF